MAAVLAGCGGGSAGAPQESIPPGEVLTFSVASGNGATHASHYLVHGVSATGDLQAHDAAGLLPDRLVALPLETAHTPENAPQLAVLRGFYKQLWQTIAAHRNEGSDIASEIGAYDTDIGTLHADFQRSGFTTVAEYVAFYEQVGEEPFFDGQESLEEELVSFFYQTGWTQNAWLQALHRHQWDWPRFLKLMAQREDTFARLLRQYETWRQQGPVSADDFVARYVGSPRLKGAVVAGDFFVTTSTWPFITMGSYYSLANAHSAVISSFARSPRHYKPTTTTSGCETEITVHGRLHGTSNTIRYNIGLTQARHADIAGTWFSSVKVNVTDIFTGTMLEVFDVALSLGLTGRAEIKDVAPADATAFPSPRFTLETKFNVSKIFNARTWTVKHTIHPGKPDLCETAAP